MDGANAALLRLRDAGVADLDVINAIYNHEVATSVATFDTEPTDRQQRRAWLDEHGGRHSVVVAEHGGRVLGWASLSPWSARCAYARAAEVSVYVHTEHRGRRVGRELLTALVARARAAGFGVLLARIESSGEASLRLHRALGFERIGVMRRVGEKLGRILDVELMELHLDGGASLQTAGSAAEAPSATRTGR